MKKILKIMAMLLVVAAVVFAAGCAEKTNTAGNQTQTPSEQVNSTPAETPAPAETSAPTVTPAVTKENVTDAATGNVTENATVQNGTHMSNKQRKLAIALNHTKSSGTFAVNGSQ